MTNQQKKPSLAISIITVIIAIVLLFYAIIFLEIDIHLPLIIAASIASLIGVFVVGLKWADIEKGIIESISTTMQAMLILAIVGSLIGAWILGGIVPTLIYYGLQILSPTFFLVASVLLSSIVALATGSSWTTAGTVGIALMGVAQGLDIPTGLAAGAVISGAYFGDKLSPLSDTTNLAPGVAGSNLFDHIRHMLYTTSISYGITLVIFTVIGFGFSAEQLDTSAIQNLLDSLAANYTISPLLLLVPVAVIIMVALKIPALPGLIVGVTLGALCAVFVQGSDTYTVFDSMMYGVVSETGNVDVDTLLSRGGLQSMMWTISLIMCALTFGGVLEKTGMLEVIASSLLSFAKSTGSLVLVTVISCLCVNLMTGDQYLGIALPAKMYKDEYKKRGLSPRNLSRACEDSGTVTSALIPWNTCGATMSTFLGIPTTEYMFFCFFNLLSPIVSVLAGYTGFTMMKLEDDPSAEEYKGAKGAKTA